MDDSAWWRDVATRSKTSVVDLLFEGGFNKIGRAQRKKRDHGKETTIEFRQNGTTTMHPIQGSVFKPFPCHCFYLCFFGTTKTLFFFSFLFFGVLSLRKRGRCDRLNRGRIDCIGMARGKDDGTAFAVDERGNGEV
jgi:hypothetical protein